MIIIIKGKRLAEIVDFSVKYFVRCNEYLGNKQERERERERRRERENTEFTIINCVQKERPIVLQV